MAMNKQRRTSNLSNILNYDDAGNIVLRDYSQTIRYNWNGTIHAFTGPLSISSIAAAVTDTDRFLVSDGGVLKYRTGTEVLSDIGGQAALGYTPVPTTRTLTINGTAFDLSADRSWTIAAGITGTGATGQVAYWNGTTSQTGSNNLFWDAANSRLGIGTNSPNAKLDVRGASYIYSNAAALSLLGTDHVYMEFYPTGSPTRGAYIGFQSAGSTKLKIANEIATGDVNFSSGNSVNPQMTLTAAGRLLLGTTDEGTFRLDVLGTARVSDEAIINEIKVTRNGTTSGNFCTYIGNSSWGATTLQYNTFVGGAISVGTGNRNVGIGSAVTVSGTANVAIGHNAVANGSAISIGASTWALANTAVFGSSIYPIGDVYFGNGVQRSSDGAYVSGTGQSVSLNASGAFGTNQIGGTLTIAGGKGTGSGASGDVVISTATTTTSGTTLQTLTPRLEVFGNTGNVLIQNGGTFTDAGFRLDVNGTARVSGDITNVGNYIQTPNTNGLQIGFWSSSSPSTRSNISITNSGTGGTGNAQAFPIMTGLRNIYLVGTDIPSATGSPTISGNDNLILGNASIGNPISGSSNTLIKSRGQISTGIGNTGIGNNALNGITTGSYNLHLTFSLGTGNGSFSSSLSNSVYIGDPVKTNNNTTVAGDIVITTPYTVSTQFWFGGKSDASDIYFNIPTRAGSTNGIGYDSYTRAGIGTGSAEPGKLIFQHSTPIASGLTLQSSFTNTLTLERTRIYTASIVNVGIGGAPYAINSLEVSTPNKWSGAFIGNLDGARAPSVAYGIHLGWNYSGGSAESNFIWGTGGGSPGTPYLRFSTWNGTAKDDIVEFHDTGKINFSKYTSTSSFTGTAAGYLAFDVSGNILTVAAPSGGGVTSVATTGPITGGTITTTGAIGITQSTTSTDGYLSSTDWNTFNNKVSSNIYNANGTLTGNRVVSAGSGFSLVLNPQTAVVTTLNAVTSTSTTALVGQNSLTYASGFSSSNAGSVYGGIAGINLQTFNGSATFSQFNLAANALVNSIDFSLAGSGSTITMTQATGIRTMSGSQSQVQYQGTYSGTVSHVAVHQILGLYRPSSATGTLTVNKVYSLLINALDDYGASGLSLGGVGGANRWGIYQNGASDNNYFKGKVIIGSTDTVGSSRLNVKDLPTSATGLATGDVWNNGGVLNIV
jgi:hypothetical protein